MRTMTATSASRGFSELLDRVESGEVVRIVRGGHTVAELRPVPLATGRSLRAALATMAPPDDDFATSIATSVALLNEQEDPWRDD